MRDFLQTALVVLQIVVCLSLVAKRLAKQHLALIGYLTFAVAFSLYIQGVDPHSGDYLRKWAFFLPVSTLLSIAVGWQAYGRSLETSPRAQAMSHKLLLGLCVCAALLGQLAQDTVTAYGVFSRIDQAVSAALGLFCLTMTPLLNHFYSPRRRRNARFQEWILTIGYGGNALSLLATHWQLFPFNAYLLIGASILCCLGWIFLLTREGETLPPAQPAHDDDRLEKLAAEAQFAAIARRVKSATRSK